MAPLLVVTHTLAVVTDHNHQRVLGATDLIEHLQQVAHFRVGIGDLSFVEMGVSFGVGARRCPGHVRVVVMNPEEEPFAGVGP